LGSSLVNPAVKLLAGALELAVPVPPEAAEDEDAAVEATDEAPEAAEEEAGAEEATDEASETAEVELLVGAATA
jgi:hypothetical protein